MKALGTVVGECSLTLAESILLDEVSLDDWGHGQKSARYSKLPHGGKPRSKSRKPWLASDGTGNVEDRDRLQ